MGDHSMKVGDTIIPIRTFKTINGLFNKGSEYIVGPANINELRKHKSNLLVRPSIKQNVQQVDINPIKQEEK